MTSSDCKQDVHKHPAIIKQKKLHATLKQFFFVANYKTFPIFEGFEQFFSIILRRVMASYGPW